MVGSQIDERRWYGKFDKEKILKRTGGICACCGKKLNLKTMTVEHVIPISRGGYDSERNTIALCEDCNKMKGNMLYIPRWFYSAVADKPLSMELTDMFVEWFQTVKADFDINMYPLIAPKHNLLLSFSMTSKVQYVKGNVIQWHYTGKQYMDEVEQTTGVNLRELRNDVGIIMPKHPNGKPPVALYTCRKLTTNKILALAAVSLNIEEKMAAICMEWSELPKKFRPTIYFSIIRLLNDVLNITSYDITDILFFAPSSDTYAIEEIQMRHMYDLYVPMGKQCQARIVEIKDSKKDKHYTGLQIKIYKKGEFIMPFEKFRMYEASLEEIRGEK